MIRRPLALIDRLVTQDSTTILAKAVHAVKVGVVATGILLVTPLWSLRCCGIHVSSRPSEGKRRVSTPSPVAPGDGRLAERPNVDGAPEDAQSEQRTVSKTTAFKEGHVARQRLRQRLRKILFDDVPEPRDRMPRPSSRRDAPNDISLRVKISVPPLSATLSPAAASNSMSGVATSHRRSPKPGVAMSDERRHVIRAAARSGYPSDAGVLLDRDAT